MKAALCWFVLLLAASCSLASEGTSLVSCNYLEASVVIVVDVSGRTYTTETCTRTGYWFHTQINKCSTTRHLDHTPFNSATTFVNKLVGAIENYINPSDARIGVVTFSYGTPIVQLQFADNHCHQNVSVALTQLQFAPTYTSTYRGLQQARTMLASSHARSDVSHLVVLVTDMKNFDEASTGFQVDQMKASRIQLISVLVNADPVNAKIYDYSSSVYTWSGHQDGHQEETVANKIKELSCQPPASCNNLRASVAIEVDVSGRTYTTRSCTTSGWWWGKDTTCSTRTHLDPRPFNSAKTFINKLVGALEDYVNPREIRIGLVAFSYGIPKVHLQFENNHYLQNVNDALTRLQNVPSFTNTSGGLHEAQTMLASTHARSDANHLVLLVTDMNSFDEDSTGLEVDQMNSSGIQLISVLVNAYRVNAQIYTYSSSVYAWSGHQEQSIANKIEELGCQPLCAWDQDSCFPGQCGNSSLAKDCKCRQGFKRAPERDKRCEIDRRPELAECSLHLTDAQGNLVFPKRSGSSACEDQQHGFIGSKPVNVTFDLSAFFILSVGSAPYVSEGMVGLRGFKLNVSRISGSVWESVTNQTEITWDRQPYCTSRVNKTSPPSQLHCNGTIPLTSGFSLSDGDKVCMETSAVGGGFYVLRNPPGNRTRHVQFRNVTTAHTTCFTYDGTRPVHCTDTRAAAIAACNRSSETIIGSPLALSTRLTRSADIQVVVGGWVELEPTGAAGGPGYNSASGISGYFLEVHETHVSPTQITVKEEAASRTRLNGDSPYNVAVRLPTTSSGEVCLFAVILEVHDEVGNVGYARRLVLHDNSSRLLLNPQSSLKITSAVILGADANGDNGHAWQTDFTKAVCLDWKGRFYNDAFRRSNFLLPVREDTARGIAGIYDQTTGDLPVTGTRSVSGVVKFEISWRPQQGSHTPWRTIGDPTPESACLPNLSLRDGGIYHIFVRATDVMGRTITDDVTLYSDSTPPDLEVLGLTDPEGRATGALVTSSKDLSSIGMVVEAADPLTGLSSLHWSLREEGSADELGSRAVAVQRLGNRTCLSEQGPISHCYCPVVGGECENRRYDISFNNLVHSNKLLGDHGVYFLTFSATNRAGLNTSSRAVKIMTGVSPPTLGVVLEGGGASDTSEMDFTSQFVVHVRWHGFRDHVSGVRRYRVVLAGRCLSAHEMQTAANATEVVIPDTPGAAPPLATSFTFPSEGRYFTNVVAYNEARAPSPVACSDGIVYDTSAPRLSNVSVAHLRVSRELFCAKPTPATDETGKASTWLFTSGLTRTRLSNTSACWEVCPGNQTEHELDAVAAYVSRFPETSATLDVLESSEELCRDLPMMTAGGSRDRWLVLPSDRLYMTWASEEEESSIEEFYVGAGTSRASAADLISMTATHRQHVYHNSRTGLGHGKIFYLFLKAVNKAGVVSEMVVGPVLVDSTPPEVIAIPTASVDDRYDVTITWSESDIVDPEQPAGFGFEITYRVGHSEGFVTAFQRLKMPDTTSCRRRNSDVAGCVRLPVDSLRPHDLGGRVFFCQLHVVNAAGLSTTVNSSSFHLPPPRTSHVVVKDVRPSDVAAAAAAARRNAESEVTKDVDAVLSPDVLCAEWTRPAISYDLDRVQMHLGVGRTNETDDVVQFSIVDVTERQACVNITSPLPFYDKLYSIIWLTTGNVSAVFSSDGFVVIPPSDPQNTGEVFTGRGCAPTDLVHQQTVAVQNPQQTLALPGHNSFHVGDVLFVELHPFASNVQFSDAHVIETTQTGYEIILASDSFSVDLSQMVLNASVAVRVYRSCLKDDMLWGKAESLVTSWELAGPAVRFADHLRVQVVDATCVQRANNDADKLLACTAAESHVSTASRNASFANELKLFPGHSYTTSVAVCLDNDCLPAYRSREFTVNPDDVVVTIDRAEITRSQSSSSSSPALSTNLTLNLNLTASIEPALLNYPCYFLWSVAKAANGTQRLSSWKLQEEVNCDTIHVNAGVHYSGHARGTLYACIRPVFPRGASAPACQKLKRSFVDEERDARAQPYHVIELSQNQLQRLDPDDYLFLQHVDDYIHDLYDLDLDFAGVDLQVGALVTNGLEHSVRWFFMVEVARVPPNGDCASDPACMTSSSDNKAFVHFPRHLTNLESGNVYFVCALVTRPAEGATGQMSTPTEARAARAERVEVCGDGFLVDADPPSPGSVTVLSARGSGFLVEEGHVTVTWSGFRDAETEEAGRMEQWGGASSAGLSYSVALGSVPGGEDVASYVSVDRRTEWTFRDVHLVPGQDCFATVKARDMAGHVTQMFSEPVVFDNTPPTKGTVIVKSGTTGSRGDSACAVSSRLHVHVGRDIEDPESGIIEQEVTVGSERLHRTAGSGKAEDVHKPVTPFVSVRGGSSATILDFSPHVVSGHTYVVLLKSTNGAGLASISSSDPFKVTDFPPDSGNVWVNASDSHSSTRDVYVVQWSGFSDRLCGLAHYRVGIGSSPDQDDIISFHYVGLQTSYTWSGMLDSGGMYFAVVEACNYAGLCRYASSAGFFVDHTPPTSGHVIVGSNQLHRPFWGHDTFLEASWLGFSDPQSGIREFRWCIGRSPGNCDIMPMTSSLHGRTGVTTNTSLPSGVPLYVTVVAENYAGMKTSSSSTSFVVDTSPPEILTGPTFLSPTTGTSITNQTDRSMLLITWSATDPDTPVLSHTVSVSSQGQGRHGLPDPVLVVSSDSHHQVTLQLDQGNLLADGDVYTASVTVCNAADLCATAVSARPLLVDSTPPVVGTFKPEMTWNVSSDGNGSDVTWVDAAWSDFADEESGLRGYHITAGRSYSSHELSGGSEFVPHQYQQQNNASASPVQRYSLPINETLQSGELVVFSVWAENSLGLISSVRRTTFEIFFSSATGSAGTLVQQRHSCSPYYCSNERQTCQPRNGTAAMTCRNLSSSKNDSTSSGFDLNPRLVCSSCDLGYITSASCLAGDWTSPADLNVSSVDISRVQWTFGLSGSLPGAGVFDSGSEPVWYDTGPRSSATYCLPGSMPLSSGSSYVLQVRAWLSHDSYVTQTSRPVVVDHSPPVRRRGRSVRESVDVPACGKGDDVDVFSDELHSTLSGCWGRVFSDEESGIQRYDVWIGTMPFGDDYQRTQNVYLNTSITINTSAMVAGTRYYVTVRATNGAGLTSTLSSDGVIKDVTPPVAGAVYASSRHATRHVTDDVTSLSASWHGFHDLHSGVTSFSVALFDADDVSVPVVNFSPVKLRKSHRFHNLALIHGHRYKVAVKARDAAGLESAVAWSPAILADVTPPHGMTCSDFSTQAIATATLTSSTAETARSSVSPSSSPSNSSSILSSSPASVLYIRREEQYEATLTILAPFANNSGAPLFLKVALTTATSLGPGVRAAITMNDVTVTAGFRRDSLSTGSRAEHVLVVTRRGRADVMAEEKIAVVVHGNAGADILAQVFPCSQSAVLNNEAVVLRQISANALSLSATIADAESSLTTLKIGVGTTPGGMQVLQPLTTAATGGQHSGSGSGSKGGGGGEGNVSWTVTTVDASQVLHGAELYAVVWAQNQAQTWARFVSTSPVVFDLTPPAISEVNVTLTAAGRDGNADGGAGGTGGAVSTSSVMTAVAMWSAVDEESGSVACTCSLAGHTSGDDVKRLIDDVTTGHCEWELTNPRHGSRFHAVVSCWNQIGIVTTKTSDEVVVLTKPPDLSKVSLRSLPNSDHFSPYERSETWMRSSAHDLQFVWTAMDDSTVDHYQYRFSLGSTPLASGWSFLPPYKTSATLPKSAGRQGNVTAEVRALNRNQKMSGVLSTRITLHDAKPLLTGTRATVTLTNRTLHLDWSGVFNVDRDVTFSVQAGTEEDFGDVINHHVTMATSYDAPYDVPLRKLYLIIQCIYRNGLWDMYHDDFVL